MKKIITIASIFFLPSFLARPILRILGHKIGKKVRFGFSVIKVSTITIGNYSKIGHFNFITNKNLTLENNTIIKHLNVIKGPFSLILKGRARIANQNYITRAKKGITYGDAKFEIGTNSNITSMHFIDVTSNVILGDETVLGGRHSQIWTHGYVHDSVTHKRIRIDGDVTIGNDVYFGSKIIINPGVTITNGVSVGSGSVISKDLCKKGMYVGQALRQVTQDFETIQQNFIKVEDTDLIEDVYKK